MLKKPYRLKERERFIAIRNAGRSAAHPLVVLTYLPNELPVSRFGFAVSRRVGDAVRRNRVKRLLRESIRLRLETIVPGYDMVLIARRPIAGASFEAVDAAVARLLLRGGLLRIPDMPVGAGLPGVEEQSSEV